MKEDCIFCKIAKGEIHSATVYEDSHFTVILDVNPATTLFRIMERLQDRL